MMKKGLLPGIIAISAVVVVTAVCMGTWVFSEREDVESVPEVSVGGFSGVLVDATAGLPLGKARIVARDAESERVVSECVSDVDGAFSLELPDGSFLVSAEKIGYVKRGQRDVGRNIHVNDGTRFVNARLELYPGSSVVGRIVAGNVGIKAEVELNYVRDKSGAVDYVYKTINTGEDGRFQIDDAYAGTVSVAVSAEGYASLLLDNLSLVSGQALDLGDIPMRDGVSLFGQVVDNANGQPISGVLVSVTDANGKKLGQSYTSKNGMYRLPVLDMIQVAVTVSAEGYRGESRRLRLSGNSNSELSFALKRDYGLSLDIQNKTGRDPIKTWIKIVDASTGKTVHEQSYDNGKYALNDLKGGPFIVYADAYDRMTHLMVRASTGDNVSLQLKPFGKISLKVFESDGSPLTQGSYRLLYHEGELPGTTNPWTSFSASEFDIPELPSGYYRVELKKDGSKEVSSPEFLLHDGDVRYLTLRLTEGGVLKGHVVSAALHLDMVATVSVEGTNITTGTDRYGYFTIDKLPDTPFTLVVKPIRDDGESRFEHIVVKNNDTLEREFSIEAPKTERRLQREARFEEMRANGEIPAPPWGDGKPPWGDGPPPWANGEKPPWGDGKPPWGDGPPPFGDGEKLPWGDGNPPWGDGKPPWGDGKPPWGDGDGAAPGDVPAPPWGDGEPPWMNNNAAPQDDSEVQSQDHSENQSSGEPDPVVVKGNPKGRSIGRANGRIIR